MSNQGVSSPLPYSSNIPSGGGAEEEVKKGLPAKNDNPTHNGSTVAMPEADTVPNMPEGDSLPATALNQRKPTPAASEGTLNKSVDSIETIEHQWQSYIAECSNDPVPEGYLTKHEFISRVKNWLDENELHPSLERIKAGHEHPDPTAISDTAAKRLLNTLQEKMDTKTQHDELYSYLHDELSYILTKVPDRVDGDVPYTTAKVLNERMREHLKTDQQLIDAMDFISTCRSKKADNPPTADQVGNINALYDLEVLNNPLANTCEDSMGEWIKLLNKTGIITYCPKPSDSKFTGDTVWYYTVRLEESELVKLQKVMPAKQPASKSEREISSEKVDQANANGTRSVSLEEQFETVLGPDYIKNASL